MKKIRIEGVIDPYFGDSNAKTIAEAVEDAGDAGLEIILNSPGGDVFEGIAIYNELKAYEGKKKIVVRGMAASAATIVMMAGDEIVAEAGVEIMVHGPWTFAAGNAGDFRNIADRLDKIASEMVNIYATREGIDIDTAAEWVEGEFYFTGDEALKAGLVDSVKGKKQNKEKSTNAKDALQLVAQQGRERMVQRIAAQAANITQEVSDVDPKGDEPMGNEQTPKAPLAATPDEIKALCPKADAEWVLEQVIAEATKEQVLENYAKHLEDQIEGKGNSESEMQAKLENLEKELEEAKAKKPIGAQALEDSGKPDTSFEGGAMCFLKNNVATLKASGVDHFEAYDTVFNNNPGLYEEIQREKGEC
jgi:ATP-dependent Clp endopeptidase proteolytic subunit ClpP